MPRRVEFNLSKWLAGIRLIQFDTVTFVAIAFSLLLFSALANRAFLIHGNFYAEIPTVLFAVVLVFSGATAKPQLVKTLTVKVLAAVAILAPFIIIGMVRGAPFTDAYADFRAIMLMVAAAVILFAMDDLDAVRFIVISGVLCILSFVAVYALKLEHIFIPADSVDSGKVTFPWPIFVALALYSAYRRSLLVFAIIGAFVFLALHTSYRYAYLVTALTVVACVIGPFLRARIFNATTKALVMTTLAVVAASAITVSRYEIVPILNQGAVYARNLGLPDTFVYQLFEKPIMAMTVQVNEGDLTYLNFAHHLLDVPRFAIPQGLGHKSSYGDPLIFGGNTIDNSVIFVDYHFSIWALFAIIGFAGYSYWSRTRSATWQQHAQNAIIALPVLFLIYIRASWFVDVTNALSLAMAARMLSILASPPAAFTRAALPSRVVRSAIPIPTVAAKYLRKMVTDSRERDSLRSAIWRPHRASE